MAFYFYDLETTGLNPFYDRIMQFGGQRLDEDLQPLSEPEEFYVRLSDDILPSPGAIATHKILPQSANLEGVNESQFISWLEKEAYLKGTIFAGYNLISFDNQFMRWLHWRNFAEPAPMLPAGASFDVYYLLRLASDLRPEGLNWPYDEVRKKTRLTLSLLAEANKVEHQRAHSAAADVRATVELARLVKKAQPKLFDHFLKLGQVDFVKAIISQQPFLYNHFSNLAFGSSTTLAAVLAEHPTRVDCWIVYDLRQDVVAWQNLSAYDLSLRLKKIGSTDKIATPFSVLDMKQMPVVAPLSALDKDSAARLKLDKKKVMKNLQALEASGLAKKISEAYLKLSQDSAGDSLEASLAKAKISENDAQKRVELRKAKADKIAGLNLEFEDERFKYLQFLYQARNFPKTLKPDQVMEWEKYKEKIFRGGKPSGLDLFTRQLRQSLAKFHDDAEVLNVLEELQCYIENIIPSRDVD